MEAESTHRTHRGDDVRSVDGDPAEASHHYAMTAFASRARHGGPVGAVLVTWGEAMACVCPSCALFIDCAAVHTFVPIGAERVAEWQRGTACDWCAMPYPHIAKPPPPEAGCCPGCSQRLDPGSGRCRAGCAFGDDNPTYADGFAHGHYVARLSIIADLAGLHAHLYGPRLPVSSILDTAAEGVRQAIKRVRLSHR